MCLIWGGGSTINKVFALAESHTGSNQALKSLVPAAGPMELGPQSGALAYHNIPHVLASFREAINHPAFLRSTHPVCRPCGFRNNRQPGPETQPPIHRTHSSPVRLCVHLSPTDNSQGLDNNPAVGHWDEQTEQQNTPPRNRELGRNEHPKPLKEGL